MTPADEALVRHVAASQPTTVRACAEASERSLDATVKRVRRLVAAQVLRHEPRIPRTIRLHPSVVVTDRGVYQLEKMP